MFGRYAIHLFLSFIFVPAFAEPGGNLPFDCGAALLGGATIKQVKKHLKIPKKDSLIAFNAPYLRLVSSNNIEVNIVMGQFNDSFILQNTSFEVRHRRFQDDIVDAQEFNDHPLGFTLKHMWFSKDFRELRFLALRDDGRPFVVIRLHFYTPFNISMFSDPETHIRTVEFETTVAKLKIDGLLPDNLRVLPPQKRIRAQFTGDEANQIFVVIDSAVPYANNAVIEERAYEILSTDNVPSRLRRILRPKLDLKIYRSALVASKTIGKPETTKVLFIPETQIEADHVLSGLRGLGLRKDHPIFSFSESPGE